jgi:proteasome component ECM29
MSGILTALVPERAKALNTHFNAVMQDLLTELGSRQWRNRQAACLATADLIQGRPWPQMRPHFQKLWEMALRAVDDVKESVRLNGERLFRATSSHTQRCVLACCILCRPLSSCYSSNRACMSAPQ